MALDYTDVYDRAAFAFTFIACSECDEDIACSRRFKSKYRTGTDEWYHALGQYAKEQGWLVMIKADCSDFFILCPVCRARQHTEQRGDGTIAR